VDDDDRARRWALVLPHRERLLAVARRLVRDPGDAEACVQEAMLRCVEFDTLDESNVVGFLVVTTRRLCVDHHRVHARDGQLSAKLTGMTVPEPRFDEAVCDRAEAAWVTARLADLPERQRAVVRARSAGRTPGEIAAYLDVSYKTVETLLYRARARARAELDKAYALLALTARRPRTGWEAIGYASAAAVASASLLFAPNPAATPRVALPAAPAAPRPAGSAVAPRGAAPAGVVPAPRPVAHVVLTASPAPPPVPRVRETDQVATLPPKCPVPPYRADPCVDPPTEPPDDPLDLPVLDCLEGIDLSAGFRCGSPSGSPEPEGAPR
jgi:RNA polymerase sigma factor (sigma-70 family)